MVRRSPHVLPRYMFLILPQDVIRSVARFRLRAHPTTWNMTWIQNTSPACDRGAAGEAAGAAAAATKGAAAAAAVAAAAATATAIRVKKQQEQWCRRLTALTPTKRGRRPGLPWHRTVEVHQDQTISKIKLVEWLVNVRALWRLVDSIKYY